jgi:hypothetical protein
MNNEVSIKLLLCYVDLYSKKVELGTKYFMLCREARKAGEWEKAEFIENMLFKPAEMQEDYVARKIRGLFI